MKVFDILSGFLCVGQGKTEYFTWEETETDVTKLALSFYSGLFAYNGWNYLNFIIEELQVVKDPHCLRNGIMIVFPLKYRESGGAVKVIFIFQNKSL